MLSECCVNGRPTFFRVGFAGGPVTDDLGVTNASAADAEATAIIASVEYILSRAALQHIHIYFHYDATVVGHGAFGWQNVPGHPFPTTIR